jgi:hypothetical protein
MDLKRKIEIVTQAVESISSHRDADSVVRLAALDAVLAHVSVARTHIASELTEEVSALTAQQE